MGFYKNTPLSCFPLKFIEAGESLATVTCGHHTNVSTLAVAKNLWTPHRFHLVQRPLDDRTKKHWDIQAVNRQWQNVRPLRHHFLSNAVGFFTFLSVFRTSLSSELLFAC